MKTGSMRLAAGLVVGGTLSVHSMIAPAAALEAVQLQKGAAIEAEAKDSAALSIQSGEVNAIQSAPGFSQRSAAVESLLRKATPQPTLSLPIPPENFIYQNGGVGLASGSVNRVNLRGCFHANYGVLGGSSDRVLPGPLTAKADSGISPYLDPAAIQRLQSVTTTFRYAYAGGYRSNLSLYVVNLTNGKTQFVGALPPTIVGKAAPCRQVTQDLTHYITEPGVYGIRLVLLNRGRLFPIHPPDQPMLKAGDNPGDVVQLEAATPTEMIAEPTGKVAYEDDVRRPVILPYPPRPPIYRSPVVAGFNNVIINVTRNH
jgi:hypothetical protein